MRFIVALMLAGCGFSEVKADLGGASPDLANGAVGLDLAGVAADLAGASAHKRVFVSRNSVPGDMNSSSGGAPGLLGADLLCVQFAIAGHLGSSWRAWLSDSQTNAVDRVLGAGPWYRTDDALVFPDRDALTRGPLVAINRDELGAAVPSDSGVWTATGFDGLLNIGAAAITDGTCGDWTTVAPMTHGDVGDADATDHTWTEINTEFCSVGARLYCFESP